jgi:hypothetical protein
MHAGEIGTVDGQGGVTVVRTVDKTVCDGMGDAICTGTRKTLRAAHERSRWLTAARTCGLLACSTSLALTSLVATAPVAGADRDVAGCVIVSDPRPGHVHLGIRIGRRLRLRKAAVGGTGQPNCFARQPF